MQYSSTFLDRHRSFVTTGKKVMSRTKEGERLMVSPEDFQHEIRSAGATLIVLMSGKLINRNQRDQS
jgi:hypothetical protein